jgi:hypothetical protein
MFMPALSAEVAVSPQMERQHRENRLLMMWF